MHPIRIFVGVLLSANVEWKPQTERRNDGKDEGKLLAHNGQIAAAQPYLEQFARNAPPALYAKDIREVTALLKSGHR